uniref:lipopolysaccharide-induced tumor necrosis factor-alpha factor homolog n=1 Tax=Monopterus albus TaxID=43700 RepID=UPI0009B3EA91|nr:lipopolysaccharide-induced tumor necrosis factor-alpha factor homolog [Monopterus albus]
MDPPSYEEASRCPPLSSSAPPPPTYREAVQPNPFPVLTPPTVPVAVASPSQDTGIIVHPQTLIGVPCSVCTGSTLPVVQIQPPPALVSVTHLSDSPGLVSCPHCHHVVTTKIKNVPGRDAWCLCICIAVLGLICGFCLIPLMIRGLQDVHHYCPLCGNCLHIYKR